MRPAIEQRHISEALPAMQSELFGVLKDYVEGRLSHADWREWWAARAGEIESQCDRFTFLRLKHRGFGGAVAILTEQGVAFEAVTNFCRRCGEPLFTALPGKTSVEEIRAFAEASRLGGWESIVRDGWIHPGQYCPNGCTVRMWNIR